MADLTDDNSLPAATWIDRYNDENGDEEDLKATIGKIGEWTEHFLGPKHACVVMKALTESLTSGEVQERNESLSTWRKMLDEASRRISWPDLAAPMTDLFAYGAGGVIRGKFIERGEEREKLLALGAKALSLLPSNWGCEQSIRRTITLAQARAKLDAEFEYLSLEEISLVGDVAMQTVRNAASNGALGRVTDKKVRANAARSWLGARESFQPSRWQDPDPDDDPTAGPNAVADEDEEYFFVPKSKDGDLFLPTLAKGLRSLNGALGYRIGVKGNEHYVADYYEALALLNKMPTPRWRRPNENGHPGIVSAPSCRSFERMRKSDLDRMIAEVRTST